MALEKEVKRHLRVALVALAERYQKLAPAAHLSEWYGLDDAAGLAARKEREAMAAAKDYFMGLLADQGAGDEPPAARCTSRGGEKANGEQPSGAGGEQGVPRSRAKRGGKAGPETAGAKAE